MVITQQQIRRAVPEVSNKNLDAFVAYWNQYAEAFEIKTPLRVAHALAQIIWESNYLKATEENLNYSADGLLRTWPSRFTREKAAEYARKPEKIANYVYANRMGNGNEASGDGWRYRGRGLIMCTGKEQYQRYAKSDWCIGDPVKDPELLSTYPECLKSAFWYWDEHKLNELADRDDIDAITRKINGGMNGKANRAFLLRRFKKEWGIVKY